MMFLFVKTSSSKKEASPCDSSSLWTWAIAMIGMHLKYFLPKKSWKLSQLNYRWSHSIQAIGEKLPNATDTLTGPVKLELSALFHIHFATTVIEPGCQRTEKFTNACSPPSERISRRPYAREYLMMNSHKS